MQESNYHRTATWLLLCGKDPNQDENLSVQIGCDVEETLEFLDTLEFGFHSDMREETHELMKDVTRGLSALHTLSQMIKAGVIGARIQPDKRQAALDALCDREITGNGLAFFAGFDKEKADQKVIDSNYAKLVDGKPVILEGGKIGKPRGWVAPDLRDCV